MRSFSLPVSCMQLALLFALSCCCASGESLRRGALNAIDAASSRLTETAHPPSHPAWFAWLLLTMLAVAIPVQYYRRRVKSMEGQVHILLEERNRLARDCHDTLMAGFTAIHLQLDATAKLLRDGGLTATPAAKSCDVARTMVSASQAEARRMISNLREGEHAIADAALSQTLAEAQLHPLISTMVRVEGEERPLASAQVHHLVCISREAVTNAVRHGQATRIVIRLAYGRDALDLTIRDDGRGFQTAGDPVLPGVHFGIRGMKERAHQLGGAFFIECASGAGTEVRVRIPLSAKRDTAAQNHHFPSWTNA